MICKKDLGHVLKKTDAQHWYFGNQVSTYELVSYVGQNQHLKSETISQIYNTVKNNPQQFGSYAGLNAWSPQFTDNQLNNFIALFNNII